MFAFRKRVFFLVALCSLFCSVGLQAASFDAYVPKLLYFEGKGYGIHKGVWGDRSFSKKQALEILRVEYWNRYHGDLFKNQKVAEVLIDHLINAGEGRSGEHIKAFEAIIGVKQDGVLSKKDVERANSFYFAEQVVNPFVKYRVLYYQSLRKSAEYPGWVKRASSFFMKNTALHASIHEVSLPKDLERRYKHIRISDAYLRS